jgi:ABC-type Mn2+/Zn2+ transport system ATPase subunit
MTQAVLRARELVVRYGRTPAVQVDDLTIGPGEQVALVGPNGSGKTSLLRAVAGLTPFAGEVSLHGRPCHHRRREGRVALVPQRGEIRWDFPITVAGVVSTGRLGLRRRAERLRPGWREEILREFGLGDLADRPIGQLSGGQQQRVLLARAVAQEPDLLLLDEPFTGLDTAHVSATLTCLAALAAEGTAVVAAVHELDIVRSAFPRTVALDGVVVGDGRTSDVLDPARVERLFFSGSR